MIFATVHEPSGLHSKMPAQEILAQFLPAMRPETLNENGEKADKLISFKQM